MYQILTRYLQNSRRWLAGRPGPGGQPGPAQALGRAGRAGQPPTADQSVYIVSILYTFLYMCCMYMKYYKIAIVTACFICNGMLQLLWHTQLTCTHFLPRHGFQRAVVATPPGHLAFIRLGVKLG